ncbi:MAG TPA: HXXEE domain-containing protein [Acidobacteriaceae bacterium]|nr:HXXEE domain-containing protein [Acidobacteriaceae bacterium]
MVHWNFGLAWIAFALAVALHVADEASHDFLAVYNPNARAIRAKLHLPLPVFTLRSFLIALSSAVCLLFALAPLAFHGVQWIRIAAIPVAILVGIGNGFLHLGASVVYRRWMPGALTAPLLLAAGTWLLWSCGL